MIGIIGYLCMDVFPDLGQEPFAYVPGMLREVGSAPGHPGGTVGNTGGALCRLRENVRLGCAVADDLWGTLIMHELKEIAAQANADLRAIEFKGESSGYSLVLNPANQDRMFLVCRGVNDCLTSAAFDDSFLDGLNILHFGYPSLCKGMAERDGDETKKLFQRCRAKGIMTSLDLSLPSPDTWFYTLEWITLLKNVLPETDLFCPSIDELRFMLKMPTESPEELIDTALEMGTKAVFLKMGAEGILFKAADTDAAAEVFAKFGNGAWRGERHMVKPFPVKVVGTTGAGDSSIAGMLCGISHGFCALDAVKFASRVASYSISAMDSLSGIPTYEQIIEKDDWK